MVSTGQVVACCRRPCSAARINGPAFMRIRSSGPVRRRRKKTGPAPVPRPGQSGRLFCWMRNAPKSPCICGTKVEFRASFFSLIGKSPACALTLFCSRLLGRLCFHGRPGRLFFSGRPRRAGGKFAPLHVNSRNSRLLFGVPLPPLTPGAPNGPNNGIFGPGRGK